MTGKSLLYNKKSISLADNFRFGIVVSDRNKEITDKLLQGALKVLENSGVKADDIIVRHVPGSFELPLGAQWLAEYDDELDAVICLGCVIQGGMPHCTFIGQSVSQGIASLSLEYNIPFIYGVLTVDTIDQAIEKTGDIKGNKGEEAADAAIKMVLLQNELESEDDDDYFYIDQ